MEDPAAPIPGSGRVLISYAHDDAAHEAQVLGFYEFLRAHGVDALIDAEVAGRPQDWPDWMSAQIRQGGYVLVIGTPDYRAAAEDRLPAQERKGVRWEARALKDAFYFDPAAARDRILGVLLPGRRTDDLPDWLSSGAATYFAVTSFTRDGAENLLRVLTTQPAYIPRPLGPRPVLPAATGTGQPRVFAGMTPLTGNEVPRPALMSDLVSKVAAAGAGTVGMTTALRGAGGFGKTTLARMDEAADALRLSRSALYELIRSGRLRSVKSGRRRLVPVAALAEYVASLETAA